MKKLFTIIIVMIMGVLLINSAMANNDPIWNDVYQWWKENNKNEYEMFVDTEYNSQGFVNNGTAYYASYNCALFYDEYKTMSELIKYCRETMEDHECKNADVKIDQIGETKDGKRILRIIMTAETDFTKMPNSGMEHFTGPIYRTELICYDRICVPERWD